VAALFSILHSKLKQLIGVRKLRCAIASCVFACVYVCVSLCVSVCVLQGRDQVTIQYAHTSTSKEVFALFSRLDSGLKTFLGVAQLCQVLGSCSRYLGLSLGLCVRCLCVCVSVCVTHGL
jgi:hypothetical protein